jgi:hypothetical protein
VGKILHFNNKILFYIGGEIDEENINFFGVYCCGCWCDL